MSKEFYNYLLKLNEYERKNKYSNSLAVEIKDFEERWSKFTDEFQFPYNELLLSLENTILQIQLLNNSNIVFVGDTIRDNDEILLKNITMIASGDGKPESGSNILLAIGILIACMNPNESVEFRNSIFRDLGLFDLKMGFDGTTVRNDFKYKLNLSQEMGLWFTISRNN
ncbi:hypothetical protein M5E03_18645 [Bacillus safensis]|uniref:hypothetical protein n=1 Tax=Bacillus safensis TaxID=561879 RepID=UPI000F87AC4E|nr:hypothetical protein [Bacillus safensis]MBQ4843323.1 hypothetical protein [Bacillus safensis]MBQ4874195.1 hypothetical protein [Bacillus safensis]MBQ4887933.1 hypothetical protein [Bacillus safensis]MBU5209926.1 hypothetical protein [Bacillus safensis]RUK40710.1 hypothetical protein ELP67_18990 [Bacillus safensis]